MAQICAIDLNFSEKSYVRIAQGEQLMLDTDQLAIRINQPIGIFLIISLRKS